MACNISPRQAGRQPYNPPYMAFSLSLVYPGILSCHVPLYLIDAKILLTMLCAHATIIMHTKMLAAFLIVLIFSFCPPALLTLLSSRLKAELTWG